MIKCSNCNHEEIFGALFCSECGIRLDELAGDATDSFDAPSSIERSDIPPPAVIDGVSNARLTLYFASYETSIALDELKEYTAGRISEGQNVLPDIDLSPMEGFENGVSRIHAAFILQEDCVEVKDLGSSNGSMLNDQKMIAHLPYRLADRDVLIFGKLIARVIMKT